MEWKWNKVIVVVLLTFTMVSFSLRANEPPIEQQIRERASIKTTLEDAESRFDKMHTLGSKVGKIIVDELLDEHSEVNQRVAIVVKAGGGAHLKTALDNLFDGIEKREHIRDLMRAFGAKLEQNDNTEPLNEVFDDALYNAAQNGQIPDTDEWTDDHLDGKDPVDTSDHDETGSDESHRSIYYLPEPDGQHDGHAADGAGHDDGVGRDDGIIHYHRDGSSTQYQAPDEPTFHESTGPEDD